MIENDLRFFLALKQTKITRSSGGHKWHALFPGSHGFPWCFLRTLSQKKSGMFVADDDPMIIPKKAVLPWSIVPILIWKYLKNMLIWLVVWNIHFIFPEILGCFHHPNWLTHIFQRGGPTTNQLLISPLWKNTDAIDPTISHGAFPMESLSAPGHAGEYGGSDFQLFDPFCSAFFGVFYGKSLGGKCRM